MELPVVTWCNRLMRFGYYILFAIVPLLLTSINYELFEYNKMMAVYAITVIVTVAWIVKMQAHGKFAVRRTPIDIPIVLFVLSQLVSALFSIDPHVSWFGYYSRFNGGMWSVISYALLYFAFVSNSEIFVRTRPASDVSSIKHQASSKKQKIQISLPDTLTPDTLTRLLKLSLVTATLIASYGVLEHLGIDKSIWVQDVQNRVFSTLGQPNWLAAYLIALIPLSMALALRALKTSVKSFRSWMTFGVYAVVASLFFITLLYTRSRSGLLGLAVADVIFWGALLLGSKTQTSPVVRTSWFKTIVILHVIFVCIVFINGTYVPQIDKYVTLDGLKTLITKKITRTVSSKTTASGYVAPALESGGTESGTIRKYVWEAALTAWRSTTKTMLIGTGTETFAFAFYQFRPVAHNMTSEWDFLYNKAHNEYLNFLATTGIFGFLSYLLLLGTYIAWFTKYQVSRIKQEKNSLTPDTLTRDTFIVALFAGWVSILVTNFFGFSVVVTQIFLFLFPAASFVIDSDTPVMRELPDMHMPAWARYIPILAGVYVLYGIGEFWYADTLYAHGYQYDRAGLFAQAAPSLAHATQINPDEPNYHDELAGNYAALAVMSFSAKNATQAAQLAELAVKQSDKALSVSPKNVNYYKNRTKVFYTLADLDPSLNEQALTTLEQAVLLSPNDPKIYYNLAILAGRVGQNDQAISYLMKAKQLKPDYRDVYNALNIFYTDMKESDKARAVLEEYLKNIDPNDTQFKQTLEKP